MITRVTSTTSFSTSFSKGLYCKHRCSERGGGLGADPSFLMPKISQFLLLLLFLEHLVQEPVRLCPHLLYVLRIKVRRLLYKVLKEM